MNLELFEKIKQDIMEEPRRLYMDGFIRTWSKWEIKIDKNAPPCGTAACIAGKACLLSGKIHLDNMLAISSYAIDLLDISYLRRLEGGRVPLFYLEYWPEKLRNKHEKAKSPRGRAKAACDAIDAFIRDEF